MKIKNVYILLLILIIGSILRLLFINELPFTHDEFSAMSRLIYNSFAELIEKGIIIDGHPAGVQVFLYYWIKLVGYNEVAIKLPFIVMGILSIGLMYLIGKRWYNETIGLIAAAFLASMQFTIMYSQIARPYASGLFFCLAMVYFWSMLVFNPGKKYWLHFILYIISSALCAYNHHFSLLFAAMVGITGLFFVRKKQLLHYILSGVAIFILYIPHLNIFFFQLSVGGVESWLSKPHNDFLINFVSYLFHFSYLIYAVVVGLMVMGINQSDWSKRHTKLLIVALIWFLLPFLVGFLYSKYVAAVLQASMLIFSFPYLFFILFGHLKEQSPRMNATIVAVILLLNISTLVLDRMHFQLVTLSPYEQILKEHHEAHFNYPDKVLSILDSHKGISSYYILKDPINTHFSWSDTIGTPSEFSTFLKNKQNKYDYVYFGALAESTPVLVSIIQEYFPYIAWQKNYCGGTSYLFSTDSSKAQKPVFLSIQDYEKTIPEWEAGKKNALTDTFALSGKHSYLMDSTQEYGPKYSIPMKKIMRNKNNFIDITLQYYTSDSSMQDVMLVTSIDGGKEPVDWRSANFADYSGTEGTAGRWIKVHHTIKLSDIYLNNRKLNLNVYIWNKARKRFFVDDIQISVRMGNPYIYGLFEKL